MLKKTGIGKIAESSAVPVGGVRASLYNYDIDGDEPKPEHLSFLNSRVIPILAGKDARCWLQGSTSKTGSDAHNLALSQRRVGKVRDYLVSRGVSPTRLVVSHVGESLASLKVAEAEGDRAVALLCAPLLAPPPPPPPPPPPAPAGPKMASRFRIRLLGGISGGVAIITFDTLYFQIWDFTNNVTTFYNYRAGGIGKGAKGGPPLSATLEGPWNDFSTTGPLSTDEFAGAARFTTAGGAKWSINFVNFMSMPRGLKTNPNPLELSTGFTVGVGISSSVGKMVLGPTYPFSGP